MKHHALGLQPEALFQTVRAGQPDFSTGSHHAMPRQSRRRRIERPDHLPRSSRKTGGSGYIAIGRHFTLGDPADGVADNIEHGSAYWVRYQASVRRSPCSSVKPGW